MSEIEFKLEPMKLDLRTPADKNKVRITDNHPHPKQENVEKEEDEKNILKNVSLL